MADMNVLLAIRDHAPGRVVELNAENDRLLLKVRANLVEIVRLQLHQRLDEVPTPSAAPEPE